MSHTTLAELLGVRTKSVQWERPQLFFAALFFSELSWLVIEPLSTWLFTSDPPAFPPPMSGLRALLDDLMLAVLAAVAFRRLPTAVALIAASAGYALSSRVVLYLTFGPASLAEWFSPSSIFAAGLWPLLFLAALSLAVRWLGPLWLSLPLGGIAGALANFAVTNVNYRLTLEPDRVAGFVADQFNSLPFQLLNGLLFGLVWWAGLRLTAGTDVSRDLRETQLSKGFYLGTVATGFSVSLLAFCVAVIAMIGSVSRSDVTPFLLLVGFGILVALLSGIAFLTLTYKMWAAIQDTHARTTPGRAVGLLFVPLFNFYWVFQVYRGFAEDFNKFIQRHSINVPPLSTGVFTAYGVLAVCGVIPILGWLCFLAEFFVMLAMISRICEAVNSLGKKNGVVALFT